MSKKNETLILLSSVLITGVLLAGGFWWFSKTSNFNITQIINPQNTKSSPGSSNPSQTTPTQGNKTTFTSVSNVPTGAFTYGGSTSFAPMRLAIDSAIQAAQPQFKLQYLQPTNAAPGSAQGIKSLINGEITFAQSSRPVLEQELTLANNKQFKLGQIPVAIDGLAVAVHKELNIPGLTIDQVKSIYTGKIDNWKQVGGPNIPIQAFSRRISDGGTVELFFQDILGGQAFGSKVEFIPTTTQALQKVADSPGGIYYASAPEIVPQCSIKPLPLGRTQGQYVPPYQEPFIVPSNCRDDNRNKLNIEAFQSGKYPITRNLFVVIKQNGQIEEQAGVAYANLLLTQQGQELIAQSGFVKIR
ncbi:PstS family phosphate ABC transporter substrate-binding protein [Cronbergia sp. UHCC 0137]|uniref:PstS family phosphate ABC transporter substrate-binding protein n=1 Tax=Cronbergia sp. UHCC 0137 TaxID=3110239 RepID=UPI002B213D40|nr:PstS family phosphate ABC transporter substrate-binding protein [Cronbergia sp. UHCC 0137]MEA5616388.1 PstS family phosphate ABC transporter substrate-binding protein [Cronbergia sp. UHCC 0137]